jgi:hypothetical protein
MIYRCLHPQDAGFVNYGGRGIGVFVGWLGKKGINRFVADMGLRPKGTTLDRINVNGHYTPDNCRWATPYEQTHNRRPPEEWKNYKRTPDEAIAADAGFGA